MRDKIVAFFMEFLRIEVATAGLIEKNGKILLTKRARFLVDGGKWCLPGGHLRKWESAEKGMKREIKEETGYDSKKNRLLFVHEEFIKRLNVHAVVFVYKIDISGKQKKSWEVSEYGWFDKKEAEKLEMAFTHKQILEKYWRMKK